MARISSSQDITDIIAQDQWMMDVLRTAEDLGLPDWWIGAGFLRNKIWDHMSGNPTQQTRDVDLIYFNPDDIDDKTDWRRDEQMNKKHPFAEWEVRNQARMHHKNGFDPFTSTEDGIAHWTETATAVAVRKKGNNLEYLFCYGKDDLFNMVARPTPYMNTPELQQLMKNRITKKQWQSKWPNLTIVDQPHSQPPIFEKHSCILVL